VFAPLLASLASVLNPRAAEAQVRDLRWDPAVDLTVTGIGAAAWIAGEILQDDLAPARCRWCQVDPLDASAREALRWNRPALADTLSSVSAFVLAPAAAVGLDALAAAHDGAATHVPLDAALIVEATVLAADANALAKLLVGRERPFVHALTLEEKAQMPHPSDNNLSFFSGHTTEAFALAASAGAVATMRGYRWAPLVWGVSGGFAVAAGYLRIAADRHWLTDVAVGMVVGAGIGIAVPCLFHRPESTGADSPGSLAAPVRIASFAFVW
jgi:membrane-associated phospholipid phosphatase